MGAEDWDARVGSVADEAARLLESLRRSATEATDPGEPPASGDGDAPDAQGWPEHGHTARTGAGEHDPVCQWCPICRGAAVVRSLSPQTLARLADLAGLAAAALADLATARAQAGHAGTEPGSPPGAPTATGHAAPRPPASRPIPVQDADDSLKEPRG